MTLTARSRLMLSCSLSSSHVACCGTHCRFICMNPCTVCLHALPLISIAGLPNPAYCDHNNSEKTFTHAGMVILESVWFVVLLAFCFFPRFVPVIFD